MLRRLSVHVALVVMVSGGLYAEAQTEKGQQRRPRPGGRELSGTGRGVASLLANEAVQKEIAVNEEQKKLIADMLEDLGEQPGGVRDENRESLRDLSREERRKKIEEYQKQATERELKANAIAKTVLEPKQMERLNQIQLQREGPTALTRDEIATKVGLNDEQVKKIEGIRDSAREERRSAGGGNRANQSKTDRAKAAGEERQRQEKMNNDILAVLTANQKETWQQMLGQEFKFAETRRRQNRD